MIVIGAKGFAKEVLEILHQKDQLENLCFFDDVNTNIPSKLFDKYIIYKTLEEVSSHFINISQNFIIGVGEPKIRQMLFDKFSSVGGIPYTLISNNADIGSYDNIIGSGSIVCSGVVITNSVNVGAGVLINLNSTIGHDCKIGNFVEICPNVSISGNCRIESNVFIGTSATILPNVTVGKNAIIAAGAVVCKDIPHNVVVAGIPAKIIKNL